MTFCSGASTIGVVLVSIVCVWVSMPVNAQYETEPVAYKPAAEYKTPSYGKMPEYKGTNEYKSSEDYKEEKYPHQPYGFGYNIEDGYGNKQWRHEKSSTPHQVTGTYGFKDKNGVLREVEYVADKNGFRAMIKTTEPGTASKDPAYVKMNAEPIQVEYYPPEYKGKEGYPTPSNNNQQAPAPLYQAAPAQYAMTPAYGGLYAKNTVQMDGYEGEYSGTSAPAKTKYQD